MVAARKSKASRSIEIKKVNRGFLRGLPQDFYFRPKRVSQSFCLKFLDYEWEDKWTSELQSGLTGALNWKELALQSSAFFAPYFYFRFCFSILLNSRLSFRFRSGLSFRFRVYFRFCFRFFGKGMTGMHENVNLTRYSLHVCVRNFGTFMRIKIRYLVIL